MRFGVVVFPGTWSDGDCHYVLKDILEQEVEYLWHMERPKLRDRFHCIILPGGFSYGDYLRAGALARFSPHNVCRGRVRLRGWAGNGYL